MYTCHLFLRYKREIFILGVLGFLKSEVFRRSPKPSKDVRSLPKAKLSKLSQSQPAGVRLTPKA